MLRTTTIVAAIALAVAPGTAPAAWLPTVDVAPLPYGGGYPPGLAVTDDGRAATAGIGALTEIVPGRGVTVVALPDMTPSGQVAYGPDGTFVVSGTVSSGPSYAYDPSKAPACCTRPAVARWRPGAATAALTVVQPPRALDYMISDFGLDGSGAAVLLAAGTSSPFEDDDGRVVADPVVAIRFPADGAPPVQRTLGTHASFDSLAPDPYALRARADGAGATVVWNGGHRRWRRIDITRGRWRPAADTPAGRDPYGSMLLDARGRRVTVYNARRSVFLSVQGRRPLQLADKVLRMADGPDGALTLLLRRGMRLSLRTVDPNGRLSAARPLGTLGRGSTEGPFLGVDAAGHVHAAWRKPGGDTAVAGPRGRHELPGLARAFAVSQGGTVAVALRDHGMLRVAVDRRG
jgi:hypothetical protein